MQRSVWKKVGDPWANAILARGVSQCLPLALIQSLCFLSSSPLSLKVPCSVKITSLSQSSFINNLRLGIEKNSALRDVTEGAGSVSLSVSLSLARQV